MAKDTTVTKTIPARCPTAPESHRASTDEFLDFFENRFRVSLDKHRQLSLTDRSDRMKGQIAYWKNGVQIIKWLRSMNAQRRSHA